MQDFPVDKTTYGHIAQSAALAAHSALGCRCISRVDMIATKSDGLVVLEVNTIPGLTERSLLPKAARSAGVEFPDLCEAILRDALPAVKKVIRDSTRPARGGGARWSAS